MSATAKPKSASSSGSQHMDQVKSVITLRSGKVIEKPILERCEKDDKLIYEDKEVVEPKHYMKGLISPQHFHLLMP
jgi:hypothetical protein